MKSLTFRHLLIIETVISFLLALFFFSLTITGAVVYSNNFDQNYFGVIFFVFGILGLIGLTKNK